MTELSLLYRIREALGFNQYYRLSHLDDGAKQQRAALLACAPIAFAAIAEEKKDEIGNSDLDNEQRRRLLEIADKCPVHRTLTSEINIRTVEKPPA